MVVNRAKFSRLTPGVRSDTQPSTENQPQQGIVRSVTAAGVMVVLDAFPGQSFGPMPWSLGSYATRTLALTAGYNPHVDDVVLVAFAGVGIDRPWAVAWDR